MRMRLEQATRDVVRKAVQRPWWTGMDPVLLRTALALAHARKRGGRHPSQDAIDAFYVEGRPLLLGHRGAMARSPENTLGAFRAALSDGGRGVELDVQLSGDSVPIVLHDDTLDRTSAVRGRPTHFDAAELDEVDVGTWFTGWGREKVPRLAEVFASMPEGSVVNVELKGPTPAWAGLEARVVEVIRRFPRVHAIVSSFHPAQLLALREIDVDIPTALLIAEDALLPLRTAWAAPFLAPDAIHPPARLVDAGFMRAAREGDLRVHAWAVRDDREAERLLDLGVDGLIVDDVAGAATLFRRRYGSSR